MSRFRTSKIEEKIAYEIFRSCRLCGAGAGYKMPIVQNVDWDGDVPLTQKIRECVQIEVHQEDKMPPLICELCVDKVNDFYEFSEMCKQTNMKTRLRLGLPPQTMPRGAPNAGDCILGVTETIFANDDSNEPIIKHEGKQSKSKKETSDKVKMKSSENSRNSKSRLSPETNRRATRRSISSPTNILTSRNRNSKDQKNVQPKKKSSEPLKSILKKEKNNEEDILVTPKSKRGRERDSISELPVKRVKIEDTATSSKSKRKSRSPPRYRTRSPPKSRTRSPETNVCKVCKRSFPNKGRLENHVKTHQNEIKNSKTKKSPPVAETKYKDRTEKIQVRGKNDSKQKDRNICDCGKEYSTPRNLHRHRINCKYKKDVIIDPKLMAKIRPLQIRISRCDPILDKKYSISEIPHVFGLDKNCTYPYFNIKREPKTGKDAMVRIESPIKHVFDEADYIHWDSDTSTDSNNEPIQKKNKISTLSILSLKTIFSSRYLGRVRRRKRKVKTEIMEKLTEKDNFDVIDSFDDVHDLERINDSSFDQLFGNDYQDISVPNPEDIKDIGNNEGNNNKDEKLEEGNNTEDISKEENSDKDVSKEENTNKDDSIEENIDKEVSKENSNADVSKEENSNKDVGNEENSNKDVSKEENNDIDISKEENSNTEVSNEKDSNIDDSKEENINKEVTKEDTSDKEIIISNVDTKKHKLSKKIINSENSLQKEGNGNDKEDSNLNEETDKTVNNQENCYNNKNDSLKENINQKEDSLNEKANSINKDSRFNKEHVNSNECENIQELNKKDIDESNIEHKKETNGLSEEKGNKEDKVRIEQKDIQEDSIDSGNFIINIESSNSLNNELEDNKRNENPLEEKTRIENQSIEKTELKQTDIKNIEKYKDTSNNNNSNETEDILLDNKKSIEINKPENYKFNKEQTDIKEKELKDLRNEELITENDLLGDTNDTLSQGSIEFDERELDSDESLDKNIKENSGNANNEVINEDSKVKEITSTVVNGESNEDVVMDDQKLMDELNAQIGEDVMEKHLSLDDFSEDEDF